MLSESESIHLNRYNVTGILFNPTSKKPNIAKIVLEITQLQVINCDPDTPTFLPKKPDTTAPNKGKTNKTKYILNKYIIKIPAYSV
jgi:hypothetical protein